MKDFEKKHMDIPSLDSRLFPTQPWCVVAECNYAREPFEHCDKCQYCDLKMFATTKGPKEAKADSGKYRPSLVPSQMIRDVAAVREYGVKKYGDPDNWKRVERQRYVDAMYRHMLAFVDDPTGLDEESGLPHLWHIECNAAFLAELYKCEWRTD